MQSVTLTSTKHTKGFLLSSSSSAAAAAASSSSLVKFNLQYWWNSCNRSIEPSYRLKSRTRSHTYPYLDRPVLSKRHRVATMSFSTSSTKAPTETNFVSGIPIPEIIKIPVDNADDEDLYYPVNRVYCVGRNYVDHVKEMGGNPRNEAPCFFMKPSNAVIVCGRRTGTTITAKNEVVVEAPTTQISYPLATNNLHYEVELVVALGNIEGGGITNASIEDASKIVYGYGIGIDLTRRDIQSYAKQNGLPWCTSKGFDQSAPISHIYPKSLPHIYEKLHVPLMQSNRDELSVMNADRGINDIEATKLWLKVNGQIKQSGCPIREMIWSVPEIIVHLSQLYTLRGGDIIFTGTPAGVSNIVPRDTITAGMNVLGGELEFILQPP